jgi:hypothetical protein
LLFLESCTFEHVTVYPIPKKNHAEVRTGVSFVMAVSGLLVFQPLDASDTIPVLPLAFAFSSHTMAIVLPF